MLIDHLTSSSNPDFRDINIFFYSLPVSIPIHRFFELVVLRIRSVCVNGTEFVFNNTTKSVVLRCFNLMIMWIRDYYDPLIVELNLEDIIDVVADLLDIAHFFNLESISNQLKQFCGSFINNSKVSPSKSSIHLNQSKLIDPRVRMIQFSTFILSLKSTTEFCRHAATRISGTAIDLTEGLPPKYLLFIAHLRSHNLDLFKRSSFSKLVASFDNFAYWVPKFIGFHDKRYQKKIFLFIVSLLFELEKCRNYHNLLAIVTGLRTWLKTHDKFLKYLSKENRLRLQQILSLMDVGKNFGNQRKLLIDLQSCYPSICIVPWIGLFLNDLLFVLISKGGHEEPGVLNFSKYDKAYSIVEKFENLFNGSAAFKIQDCDVPELEYFDSFLDDAFMKNI
ncbi:hypothetical protein GEMRC1_008041 [Eukaryota sp. GEM-RC1]